MSEVVFVLGGARSGKSAHAEALAAKAGGRKLYIATAEPFDDEMRDRIARHRRDRASAGWDTLEEPLGLAAALMRHDRRDGVILIDCITVWLGNLMHRARPVEPAVNALCAALESAKGTIVVVANEVGLGIVPDNAEARTFRDHAGRANRRIAAIAGRVDFVAAGLPLTLKGRAPEPPPTRTGSKGPGRRA